MDNIQICVCQHTFWDHDNKGVGARSFLNTTWHVGPCRHCKCKQLITLDQWLPKLLEELEEFEQYEVQEV